MVQHAFDEFRLARFVIMTKITCSPSFFCCSKSFTSAFAFGASAVDPLIVSMDFTTKLLDFHIFGNEPLITAALERGANVLAHSPVYFVHNQIAYVFQNASLRHSPNGAEIKCCGERATYFKRKDDIVIFSCRSTQHNGIRKFGIDLLKPEPSVRWFMVGDKTRMMIARLDPPHAGVPMFM
jgi:hypothetical protein